MMLAQQSVADMQRIVDDHVYQATNGIVQGGPFKGMHLTRDTSWPETRLSPMLLGCYEGELYEPLEDILVKLQDREANVVNVGCAEGFYAVGLAHRLARAKVYAIEGHEASVEIAKAAAERNGVRIIFGADVNEVFASPDLIVMDCEGHEVAYLDMERFPGIRGAAIFVEIHEMPAGCPDFPDGQKTAQILFERFRESHQITCIFEGPRNPNQFQCLHMLPSLARWAAVQENRPCLMCWFVMLPRGKQNETDNEASANV